MKNPLSRWESGKSGSGSVNAPISEAAFQDFEDVVLVERADRLREVPELHATFSHGFEVFVARDADLRELGRQTDRSEEGFELPEALFGHRVEVRFKGHVKDAVRKRRKAANRFVVQAVAEENGRHDGEAFAVRDVVEGGEFVFDPVADPGGKGVPRHADAVSD